MVEEKYQCFKFDQPKLFEDKIGPAFKEDIYYDINLDNGLNNSNSIIKTIKVREIYAVKLIDENTYSDKQKYWLDNETFIIYDYDLKFAVGKILLTEYGIPTKLDKETFVIGEIINIPKLKY